MLSVDEFRILQAGLRFAQDQIEEAEAALGAVSPRTSDLAGQLAAPQGNPPAHRGRTPHRGERLSPAGGGNERSDTFLFPAG